MTHRWQRRAALDLIRKADALEEEARVRESMEREHAFESTTVAYLRLYHGDVRRTSTKTFRARTSMQNTVLTVQRKGELIDEFLCDTDNAPPKVAMTARDECPRCEDAPKLLLCTTRSILSCPSCGYALTYLDATSTATHFDEVIEYAQYSYKRVSHYTMWIALVQAKEAHVVPMDTLQKVMEDLYVRQNVRRSVDITIRRVRDSLRTLKLRKAYDHVVQVTSRLSGVLPPRISKSEEKKLINLFLQMQPAFQRHAPKSRTNFLSYGYVLYRSFQILGLTHMLECVTLLKGRDKLEANDLIFRRMSEQLGWPIFDLPQLTDA